MAWEYLSRFWTFLVLYGSLVKTNSGLSCDKLLVTSPCMSQSSLKSILSTIQSKFMRSGTTWNYFFALSISEIEERSSKAAMPFLKNQRWPTYSFLIYPAFLTPEEFHERYRSSWTVLSQTHLLLETMKMFGGLLWYWVHKSLLHFSSYPQLEWFSLACTTHANHGTWKFHKQKFDNHIYPWAL